MLSAFSVKLLDFAVARWEADQNLYIEDAYKWLYQATRGAEHLISSREKARLALEKEWDSVGPPHEGEPEWCPLSPDERVGRLNIRPFKDRGGRSADLLDAFIESSRPFDTSAADLEELWNRLGDRLGSADYGNLSHGSWSSLNLELAANGFPAIHHSTAYRAAHLPSYRIITGEAFTRLLRTLECSNDTIARSRHV